MSKYTLCGYINNAYDLDIKINKKEIEPSKNMTLSSEYKNMFDIDTIEKQIIDQRNFGIHQY